MSAMPQGVEADFPLARLTTVRTGGTADWFARPGTEPQLVELLRWARERRLEVGVVGSGSNLLVVDAGFRGIAIKLDGDLTAIAHEDDARALVRSGVLGQAAFAVGRVPREGEDDHRGAVVDHLRARRGPLHRDGDAAGRRRLDASRPGAS